MTSGALYFVLLCAATLMVGTGLAWALNTHDPRPARPCIAAASSAAPVSSSNARAGAGAQITTGDWYPKGCVH